MARENINVNPAMKLFETFTDFTGGQNSEVANERLKPNEYVIMENVDLSSRGSVRRRTGRTKLASNITGTAQGFFFYYRDGQTTPDIIVAISGYLYHYNPGTGQLVKIPITDGANTGWQFQSTLPIEAVQYKKDLFIATGTKLCELTYDTASSSFKAKTVDPYKPTAMEVVGIGTNALASTPETWFQQEVGNEFKATGTTYNKTTVTVGQPVRVIGLVQVPQSKTPQYKFEYKASGASNWVLLADWQDNLYYDWTPPGVGRYVTRVSVRDKDNTATQHTLAQDGAELKVFQTDEPTKVPDSTDIHSCRKIMLHWDRLLLTKDTKNPFNMYISDLSNPRYFPTVNSIPFDTGKREGITAMVRYRDYVVVFTKTTIHILTGKSPQDFKKTLVNDQLGCIADRSAMQMDNYIVFLSHEGVHILKPNIFFLDVMNVERLDTNIKSEITPSSDACGIVSNGQYYLCFPQEKKIYRYYYESNMWVKDVSTKLNIASFINYGSEVYNLDTTGVLYKQDKTVYKDDTDVYTLRVTSKYHDLSATFNQKKLKRLYVLARANLNSAVKYNVRVYADSQIVLTPDVGEAYVDTDGYTKWRVTTTPNMSFYAGTVFGSWVIGKAAFGSMEIAVGRANIRGKCRRVRISFEHAENVPCELFGYGMEFRLKKP